MQKCSNYAVNFVYKIRTLARRERGKERPLGLQTNSIHAPKGAWTDPHTQCVDEPCPRPRCRGVDGPVHAPTKRGRTPSTALGGRGQTPSTRPEVADGLRPHPRGWTRPCLGAWTVSVHAPLGCGRGPSTPPGLVDEVRPHACEVQGRVMLQRRCCCRCYCYGCIGVAADADAAAAAAAACCCSCPVLSCQCAQFPGDG